MSAALNVFRLSLRQMLKSRRMMFALLLAGAPAALMILVRILAAGGMADIRINGDPVSGAGIFDTMIRLLYFRLIVPVLGVSYGTGVIADEVEGKSITFLFLRPIPRRAVVVGKYMASLALGWLSVLPAACVMYLVAAPFPAFTDDIVALLKMLLVLALALAVYMALFTLTGAVLRRPLVGGLMFVLGWEPVAVLLPGYLGRLTVTFYLQNLWDSPGPGVLVLLLLALGVFLIVAVQAAARREYVLAP